MDQFDDFNAEEPGQQSQQPVTPQMDQNSNYVIQNPTYNVINSEQNPNMNVANNVADTAAPVAYMQIDQRRIPCPKCGQPVIEGARYCMHCGNLDFNDQRNQSVKKAFDKGKKIKNREEKMKKLFERKNKKMYSLNQNGVSKQEKTYTAFKKLFSLLIFILIVVATINYKTIFTGFNNFRKDQYIKQVNTIVNGVAGMYDADRCSGASGFYFYDSRDYFNTSSSLFTFKQFRGYVEIEKVGDDYHYIVTIYDGKYGIDHVDSTKITRKSIKAMNEPDMINDSFTCE